MKKIIYISIVVSILSCKNDTNTIPKEVKKNNSLVLKKDTTISIKTIEKINISEKWQGKYSLTVNADADDWKETQNATLQITETNITFEATGYQVYKNFNLSVKELNGVLFLEFISANDNTGHGEFIKKSKDFGTIKFDGENYIWKCPYIDSALSYQNKKEYILKKE